VRSPFSSRLQSGFARPFVIGLFAVLTAGGIVLAARAILIDRQVHQRYESALAFSELALAAGQLGTAAARPEPRADPTPLIERVRRARLATVAHDAGREAEAALRGVDELLMDAEAANARVAHPGQRELAARAVEWQRIAAAVDGVLPALITAARGTTVDATRSAESFIDVARLTLVVFTLLAMALAIALGALTLSTMRSNRRLMDRLQQIARQDPLTGAVNRRGLDDALATEFARALRTAQPLTLVMLDLDHFKRYNDRRGHAAGDAVLRGASQGWLKQLRPTDVLARYGGEEFTLLLPACDGDQAALLVDRLRRAVPDHQTFSAGIALWDGSESATELLQRADAALLQAKKAGRARTMIAGREPQITLPLKVA
jgi:diguanylate cyclase (GGDEF)-like protein